MTHPDPDIPALVLAGRSLSQDDLLAEHAQGRPKALIPLAGRPMVAYVIDALARSRYVPRVTVVGLDGLPGESFPVPVDLLPDAHDLLTNAETGLRHAATACPGARGVLVSSSDVPLVTAAMVDSLVETFLHTDHDLYYCAIERSVMETRFPGSRRSYVHLREGDFAGGDISMLHPTLIMQNRELWRRLSEARKSAIQQARLIGLRTALLLLTHRLSLAGAERRVSKALHIRGRVFPCPFAEVGMDVDKPFQLHIVRAEIEARARAAPTPEPDAR